MSVTLEKTNGTIAAPSRVGRPRANPRPLDRPPEEEILVVAGRLFAEKGFTATSTREIAEAAGLRQPSLFHYYPRKEKILEALLARASHWMLEHTQHLDQLSAPASAKLYRALFFDIYQTCTAPFPANALMYLPEARPPSFPEFWANEERITGALARLIGDGTREGDFVSTDPALTAAALRGMGTATATWASHHAHHGEEAAEQLAHHVAGLQLRSLLQTPDTLERVRELASHLRAAPSSA